MQEILRRPTALPKLRRRRGRALAALFAVACAAGVPAVEAFVPSGAPAAPAGLAPPANRYDLPGWLDYQQRTGAVALPEAARLFHRRGISLLRSGAYEDGVRMLRGATQLDAGFLAPHVALARHFSLRDPGQAMREVARIVDLGRTHYGLQHHFVATGLYFLFLSILLATGFVALYCAWQHRGLVRHAYQDFLERRMSKRTASAGSWIALGLPYSFGLGPFYPTLFVLGTTWGSLRRGERALFLFLLGLLIFLPYGAARYATLAVPDVATAPPFYGTVNLAHAPYSEESLERLSALAAEHPENAMVRFALAWVAQRGGRYDVAEAEWRAARELWPAEPRIPNNLGNLALLRDRQAEAERYYREAAQIDAEWAVPHYNLGQLYTRQFRYSEASEELARASSTDFDLVRNLQSGATSRAGDQLPVAWAWIDPGKQWETLLSEGQGRAVVLPAGWRAWIELNGWTSVVLALAAAVAGIVLGMWGRLRLPVRPCSNCRQEVCRRCATAFRERIYCAGCTAVQGEAAAPEFARLLMLRRRRAVQARSRRWDLLLAAALPGYGPAAVGHAWLTWCLLVLAAPWLLAALGLHAPYAYDARIGPLSPRAWDAGVLTAVFVVQLCSLALYLLLRRDEAEAEEPAVGRRSASRLPRAA